MGKHKQKCRQMLQYLYQELKCGIPPVDEVLDYLYSKGVIDRGQQIYIRGQNKPEEQASLFKPLYTAYRISSVQWSKLSYCWLPFMHFSIVLIKLAL